MADTFESLGVDVAARERETKVVEVAGTPQERDLAVLHLRLPLVPRVQATFSSEDLGDKVMKLFTHELQTGNKTFDDTVYVSSSTPAEVEALLQSEDIQSTILACVTAGGLVRIEGATIEVKALGSEKEDDPALVRLVQAALAL